MTESGVSKKVYLISMCITGVIGLGADAESKLAYALIVGAICVAGIFVQGFLDWSKNDKEK